MFNQYLPILRNRLNLYKHKNLSLNTIYFANNRIRLNLFKQKNLITTYIIYSLLPADQRQDRADRPVDRRLEEGRQTEGRAGEEDRGGRVRTRKLQV